MWRSRLSESQARIETQRYWPDAGWLKFMRNLCLMIVPLLLVSCNSLDWQVFELTYSGGSDNDGALELISDRIVTALSNEGFECESDFGHDEIHSSCVIADADWVIQATSTWVWTRYPDDEGQIPVWVRTTSTAFHPFGHSRKYNRKWVEFMTLTIHSMDDVSSVQYEVD
jgi:hypothetical protein